MHINLTPGQLSRLRSEFPSSRDKDDVIAYLCREDFETDAREGVYRIWCRLTRVDVTRTDLDRLKARRRSEGQRALFGEPTP